MIKSPHYNQKSEAEADRREKSEAEEICIYQNLESDRHNIYI